MPLPPSLRQELSNHDHNDSRYPQPPPQLPSTSHPSSHSHSKSKPNPTPRQQQQERLEAYNERNHEKFHERNRGSKKAGFKGILRLIWNCGSVANDGADVVGAVS